MKEILKNLFRLSLAAIILIFVFMGKEPNNYFIMAMLFMIWLEIMEKEPNNGR